MKLVRENIYERFQEKTDPIHDLGIGKYKVKFGDYFDPLLREYKKNYGEDYQPKYTRKYFQRFKEIVEPLIYDKFITGHTWGPDFAGETTFHAFSIIGKDGMPLFKNKYFHVEATGKGDKYLGRWAIYLWVEYVISSYE